MPYPSSRYYPAFIDITRMNIVIIGGGEVAERKVNSFVARKACVTVIAPTVTEHIADLARTKTISWHERPYQEGDLAQARLAVCACGIPAIDKRVHNEAQKRNCLVNVVDIPPLCDFIVPALVERGPLQIAISTSGTAPLVAKRIKQEIAALYDESWEQYLLLLGEVRGLIMARVPGDEDRRRPLFEALDASDLQTRLKAGEYLSAETAFAEIVVPCLQGDRKSQQKETLPPKPHNTMNSSQESRGV